MGNRFIFATTTSLKSHSSVGHTLMSSGILVLTLCNGTRAYHVVVKEKLHKHFLSQRQCKLLLNKHLTLVTNMIPILIRVTKTCHDFLIKMHLLLLVTRSQAMSLIGL